MLAAFIQWSAGKGAQVGDLARFGLVIGIAALLAGCIADPPTIYAALRQEASGLPPGVYAYDRANYEANQRALRQSSCDTQSTGATGC